MCLRVYLDWLQMFLKTNIFFSLIELTQTLKSFENSSPDLESAIIFFDNRLLFCAEIELFVKSKILIIIQKMRSESMQEWVLLFVQDFIMPISCLYFSNLTWFHLLWSHIFLVLLHFVLMTSRDTLKLMNLMMIWGWEWKMVK